MSPVCVINHKLTYVFECIVWLISMPAILIGCIVLAIIVFMFLVWVWNCIDE